jgi:hypothetical protein
MSFREARLKIKRAEKHIADLKARIAGLPDSYIASIEIDPNGIENIKHDLSDTKIATDVALIVGDAIHNLKSALDYSWLPTIEKFAPSAVNKSSKFPIYPTEKHLEDALREREIDIASPHLFSFLVSEIKPYDGGNDALWSIHKLDILDKHRLLIPVINFVGIEDIELENERGEIIRGFAWGTTDTPPHFIPIEHGLHIKNKGKVSVAVLFDEGSPLEGMEVLDMLSLYPVYVLNIVEQMESFRE